MDWLSVRFRVASATRTVTRPEKHGCAASSGQGPAALVVAAPGLGDVGEVVLNGRVHVLVMVVG
jgi:hypothetical protein